MCWVLNQKFFGKMFDFPNSWKRPSFSPSSSSSGVCFSNVRPWQTGRLYSLLVCFTLTHSLTHTESSIFIINTETLLRARKGRRLPRESNRSKHTQSHTYHLIHIHSTNTLSYSERTTLYYLNLVYYCVWCT